MKEAIYKLLAFMVSSALECADQPSPYGALRLIESAQQLIEDSTEHGIINNNSLREIAKRIALEKNAALIDRKQFHTMIEKCALELIDCT